MSQLTNNEELGSVAISGRQPESMLQKLNSCLLHEMRNTLGAVSLALTKLADPATPERENLAMQALQAVTHLTSVINSGLDLSSLQAGKSDTAQVSTTELVSSVARMGEWGGAGNKNIRIIEAIDRNVPATITTQVTRLRQVLINLLFNAIKFTPADGTITLHMAWNRQRQVLRCEVIDTGMGMPEETRVRLFQPFEQGADASHRVGGTGLGLFISRLIVEAMGGVIGVASEQGAGSTFFFELPVQLAAGPAEPQIPAEQPQIGQGATHKRVLIVEDEDMIRTLTSAILSGKGYACSVASNGEDALALAQQEDFSYVFVDSSLGAMNGVEFVAALRRHETGCGKRAIVFGMSGYAANAEFTAAGADGFLLKPFLPAQLLALLKDATAA